MYSFDLDCLQVVGYADKLNSALVPTAVPPIFQERRGPNSSVVMPPFRLVGPVVQTNILGTQRDLDRAVQGGKATLLASARPARPEHLLWIDADMQPHYEEVSRNGLVKLARAARGRAERAAAQNDLAEAAQHIGEAIAADPTDPNSFAIKAVLLQRTPDADLVEVLFAASPVDDRERFQTLMDYWTNKLDLPAPEPKPARPLQRCGHCSGEHEFLCHDGLCTECNQYWQAELDKGKT
ncbi:hypothetical protein LCGC14_1004230 [marine sediment metagenome]|uniref:Uncharacterized protein n=1 Tax=marine sediment metagenome TaxID=412755 RepID=A0A0F9QKG9_9ZZZZ